MANIRYALREVSARRTPTLAKMVILSVGIGTLNAMFAIADPLIARGLPYPRSTDLVVLGVEPAAHVPRDLPTVSDWRATGALDSLQMYRPNPDLRVRFDGERTVLHLATVTEGLFPVLGIPTPVGPADRGADLSVVLTAASAHRLVGRRDAVGARLRDEGGRVIEVVRVLPKGWTFPSDRQIAQFDAFAIVSDEAIARYPVEATRGSASGIVFIGRAAAGRSLDNVKTILQRGLRMSDGTVWVESLSDYMTKRLRPVAIGLCLGGAMLWLLCLGNATNLHFVSGRFSNKDWSIRNALGASRSDEVLLSLTGALLLSLGGILGGLLLSDVQVSVLWSVMPSDYQVFGGGGLAARNLAFAGLISAPVVASLLFASMTATRRVGIAPPGHAAAGRRPGRTLRLAALTTQSLFTTCLLTGALFLLTSYHNLMSQDTGFVGSAMVVSASYPDKLEGQALMGVVDRTLGNLRRSFGTAKVGASIGAMVDRRVLIGGGGLAINGEAVTAMRKEVTPEYFESIGNAIVAGRALSRADASYSGVVVNQSFAIHYFARQNVVGESIGQGRDVRVVGVARDAFDFALDVPPQPTVFALLDHPSGCMGDCNRVTYSVRALTSASNTRDVAGRSVRSADPDAIVLDVSTLADRLAGSIATRTFATVFASLFATVAMVLCVSGVVSMGAFVAAMRRREVAICVALGAPRRRVLKMVLGETIAASGLGVVIGLVAGAVGSRLLGHLLYGIPAGNAVVVACSGAVITSLAAMAAMASVREALRVSPSAILRAE